MAWVTPRTWSIGQLVAASDLNEQIRDNFTHLKLLVDNNGKIPALNSTYLADTSGANLTGIVKTTVDNDFTAGVQNFNGGSTTRVVLPVGTGKWAV